MGGWGVGISPRILATFARPSGPHQAQSRHALESFVSQPADGAQRIVRGTSCSRCAVENGAFCITLVSASASPIIAI